MRKPPSPLRPASPSPLPSPPLARGRGNPTGEALTALAHLDPEARLDAAIDRLRGGRRGPLAEFGIGSELRPSHELIDGRLLEAIAAQALGGEGGAVFTPAPEARLLAAFGLAHATVRRGGPAVGDAVEALLAARPHAGLASALDGLALLDPACGGGALLAAAARLAAGIGARLALHGLELSPLAARAARERLSLLGVGEADVRAGDAFLGGWPRADLVLMNPPFLRHEAIPAAGKRRAARASGLPLQADLSAHFTLASLRAAPIAALVWPDGLATSRSAAPLVAEAAARGGFVLSLRSHAAGSFAASVDTRLVVWAEGGAAATPAEAKVPLSRLTDADASSLARGSATRSVALRRSRPAPSRAASTVGAICEVRFGTKSGCNALFHLTPLGGGRYRSALAGEVELAPDDVVPLLASLKEARAPEWAEPARVLFRPARDTGTARAFVRAGEALGVQRRPTCASRPAWWRLVPGRAPAPVLYPAKVGARAFAFLNEAGLWEDKKWHVLFPAEGVDPSALALLLGATPVRLAIDEGARQLTGKQAIADVDCRVLAAAAFPSRGAIEAISRELRALRPALARDPVTTDLVAMLARPAQRELDLACGSALGLTPRGVERARRALVERVERRLARAAAIRETL